MALRRFQIQPEDMARFIRARDYSLITSRNKYFKMMKKQLHSMVDGKGLMSASEVPIANTWVSDGSSFLSGKDFISSIHLRYNCLYTKSRVRRGGRQENKCSRRCNTPETLNHILQNCHATSYHRVKRHDAVDSERTKQTKANADASVPAPGQ